MSVEFRQKTTGEYVQMLKHRKGQIILPALVITLAVACIVQGLPNLEIERQKAESQIGQIDKTLQSHNGKISFGNFISKKN